MKLKKYILIILILLIILNVTSIYATENNTCEIGANGNDFENILCQNDCENYDDTVLQTNEINQTNDEILTHSSDEDTLSTFTHYYTEVTLTVNDTSNFESTGNITINMHLSFTAIEHDGEFASQNINIYENNTLIKALKISEQNLPDLPIITGAGSIKYQADLLFNYTVHDNSYLTTSLFGHYSNTLQFEKIKNPIMTNLNSNSIIIDNIYYSNETWTNTIESLKKALNMVGNNGTIYLNNINVLQDATETIEINKNITLIGNNASFVLQKTQTLFEINPNNQVTFINLTFTSNNNYILSNKGKLQLINCTFKDNNYGLIHNAGELELTDCKIEEINRFYQTKNTNYDGLITNIGTLNMTNTIFNNNIYILPYNLPSEHDNLKGIIYNKGNLTIKNVNFTNINYRLIYNDGELTLNNILFKNTKSSSLNPIYTISTNQQLTSEYTYSNYKVQSNEIQYNEKKVDGGAIYNNNNITIINTTFETITGTNGGAIYNNNNITIINSTFETITTIGSGGAIYNKNQLTIKNSLFHNTQTPTKGYPYYDYYGGAIYTDGECKISNTIFEKTSSSTGGAIYNKNHLTIENSLFNNTRSQGDSYIKNIGGAIYTNGDCEINNTTITESKAIFGGGIYNNGRLTVNNTIISKTTAQAGGGIYNNATMNLTNCQLINNYQDQGYIYWTDHGGWQSGVCTQSGIIFNTENGKATITKSIIKDNRISCDIQDGGYEIWGVIRNKGEMDITSCLFDHNWATGLQSYGTGGGLTLYNTGKMSVMYSILLNTPAYTCNHYSPVSFLYNGNIGTSVNINYNYYSNYPNPSSIISNANPNYYFIPGFEYDYYPIKLNDNKDIILTLILTDGLYTMEFDDWDKLLILPELNTTITTLDENGQYINITANLKDYYSFNFNYTSVKGEYPIYATILNYKHTAIVDVGKEFANMTVTYNNITYNDGNITFHIKVTGNLTAPTGNITVTYNNKKIILNLTDGECNYTIDETLIPANYTMIIDYSGDDEYFRILNQYYKFTVHKIHTSVNITATEIRYGETGFVTITLTPDTAALYGNLYMDGQPFKSNIAITKTQTFDINSGAGIYNLTIVLDEDEYYTGCSASTVFIVKKWETNLTVDSKDIRIGENATINITISPGAARGKAIVSINGVNSTVSLKGATTSIPVTNLQSGTYHVTVYYLGNYQYAPSNASTTFSVERITSHITVNITNNPDLTGNIIVTANSPDCTGEVGLFINTDEIIILNLTNGSCNFEVKFKRGNNLIFIQYNGDDYYSVCTWNTTTFIEGIAIITQDDATFTEQETGYYKINLTDTDGNPYEYTQINVTFQNQTTTFTTDNHGIAYLPIKTRAGTYTITTTYKNATKTNTITVTPTKMNITIKDILAGETETITITLPVNATGKVNLTIDNIPYERTLVNGTCMVEIPDLSLGEHNLTVTYTGDSNYTNQTKTLTFHIKNSISWITITATNATYGETVTVTATVITGATGSVTFTLYNQTTIVNLTGNQATVQFDNIPAGERLITARYNGDSVYQGSSNTAVTSIKKAQPTVKIITTDLKIGENILITTFVNSDATGNVTFHILGLYSPRNRTITDGKAEWYIQPLNPGSYVLNVKYNGDNNYESTTLQEILIVNQTKTNLAVSIPSVTDGDDLMVYATLTDENDQKITGNIILTIDKDYNVIITNGEGSRNLGEFKAGTYTYTATYTGTDNLAISTFTGTFKVTKSNYKITGNTDIVQYYGATKTYNIRLLNNNNPVKGEIISITIGKNTVKVKTDNNGYATLKLSLKTGKYTITSTYKNVKVSNKITVKPTLITKNKKIKKGKTLTYTAKLLNKNGKALKNKKITFKIKGKKYKAKTNKKGVAKIKVKKLKAGKYKIITTYGKQKNTNTIIVKK